MRVLALVAAFALIAFALPAAVSPVGEVSAQCYDLGEEFGCVNPCNGVAAAYHKATGRTLYCTE